MKKYNDSIITPVVIGIRSSATLPGDMGSDLAFNEAAFAVISAEISTLGLETPSNAILSSKQFSNDYFLESLSEYVSTKLCLYRIGSSTERSTCLFAFFRSPT